MIWDLPTTVEIDGVEHKIRDKCEYRVMLNVSDALDDEELDTDNRLRCALFIFYEDWDKITNIEKAIEEMMKILNRGKEVDPNEHEKVKTIDWKHDLENLTAPMNHILGYSFRDKDKYTHWYDWAGAINEISPDSYFGQILTIRIKLSKGKPLDKQERQFYNENKKDIDLPRKLSKDEQEWLDSDW